MSAVEDLSTAEVTSTASSLKSGQPSHKRHLGAESSEAQMSSMMELSEANAAALGSSPMSPSTRGVMQQLEGIALRSPKGSMDSGRAAGSYESARGIAFGAGPARTGSHAEMARSPSPPNRELGISMSSVESAIGGAEGGGSKILRSDINPDGSSTIKVALSLYNVQQHIYLLDFQKSEGDAFSFMKLCALIITELKNLAAASRGAMSVSQTIPAPGVPPIPSGSLSVPTGIRTIDVAQQVRGSPIIGAPQSRSSPVASSSPRQAYPPIPPR